MKIERVTSLKYLGVGLDTDSGEYNGDTEEEEISSASIRI